MLFLQLVHVRLLNELPGRALAVHSSWTAGSRQDGRSRAHALDELLLLLAARVDRRLRLLALPAAAHCQPDAPAHGGQRGNRELPEPLVHGTKGQRVGAGTAYDVRADLPAGDRVHLDHRGVRDRGLGSCERVTAINGSREVSAAEVGMSSASGFPRATLFPRLSRRAR